VSVIVKVVDWWPFAFGENVMLTVQELPSARGALQPVVLNSGPGEIDKIDTSAPVWLVSFTDFTALV